MPTIRIAEFDVWREGYAGAEVSVKIAGTDSLADIFFDEDLTDAAPNPQTLISQEINERQFGKFGAPLYTAASFYLDVDGVNQTGITRPPLLTLDEEDASLATVQSSIGTEDVHLEDIVARVVHVQDFGEFLDTTDPTAAAATNNDTLTAAINAVSATGGFVILPALTFEIENVDIPANVVIKGQGRDVTILQSSDATEILEYTGDGAGIMDLTLDGVNLTAGSVGVYMKNIDNTVHERAKIMRFGTGIFAQGAHGARWPDLTVQGCTINAKLYGDDDGDTGSSFTDNFWAGKCTESVEIGLDLEYINQIVAHNTFCLGFEDNALIAVTIRGARYTDLSGSWFTGNATNLDVDDFSGGTFEDDNTVLGLWVKNFRIVGGDIDMTGELDDVVFERGLIDGTVTITLTLPGNAIIAKDVVEGSNVTIAGDGTKWLRWTTTDHGASFGQTTNNAATKAWAIDLEPGQRVILEGKVIGNCRNTDESGEYWIGVSARRPPSDLAYDTQTGNFTAGLTITGSVSGATALIVQDTDGGATGTLELREIVGEFLDDETITDTSTGSALVNGALVHKNAELLGAVTSIRAAREDDTDWAAVFAANGFEVELQVTGDTGKTVDWVVHVDCLKT